MYVVTTGIVQHKSRKRVTLLPLVAVSCPFLLLLVRIYRPGLSKKRSLEVVIDTATVLRHPDKARVRHTSNKTGLRAESDHVHYRA